MGRWGFKDNKVRSPVCCFVVHPMSGSHASLWCIYLLLYGTLLLLHGIISMGPKIFDCYTTVNDKSLIVLVSEKC